MASTEPAPGTIERKAGTSGISATIAVAATSSTATPSGTPPDADTVARDALPIIPTGSVAVCIVTAAAALWVWVNDLIAVLPVASVTLKIGRAHV